MITLLRWSVEEPASIDISKLKRVYSAVFIGQDLTLDDRLKWIESYAGAIANAIVSVGFEIQTAQISFNGRPYSVADLDATPLPKGRILFDATSLLLPDLLYLMYSAKAKGLSFDVLYVEPNNYPSVYYRPRIGSSNPEFSLSEDGPGLQMLPRFVYPMEKSHLVAALGFEGHRFGSLLESDEIVPEQITGILGVPPFVLGWEQNSYSKNYSVMQQAIKTNDASFVFCAANDPLQNYNVLRRIVDAQKGKYGRKGRVMLVPIGTKPVALSMAWFAINNEGTSILYDFIKKKPKRTVGLGKMHLWQFSIDRSA